MPDQFNTDGNGDVYSLESILAEYKGRAFVQGTGKLSKDELEEQARRIIEEYTNPPKADDPASSPEAPLEPPSQSKETQETPLEPFVWEDSAKEKKQKSPKPPKAPREPKPPKAEKPPKAPKPPKAEKPPKEPKPPKESKVKRDRSASARPGAENGFISDWLEAYDQVPAEGEDVRIYEPLLRRKQKDAPAEETAETQAPEAAPAPEEANEAPVSEPAADAPPAGEKDGEAPPEPAEEPERAADAAAEAEPSAEPEAEESPAPEAESGAPAPEPAPEQKPAPARPNKRSKPRRGELRRKEPEKPREAAAKRGIEKGLRQVERKLERVSKVEEKQARMFSDREMSEDEQEFYGIGKFSRESEEALDAEAARLAEERAERRRARAQARRRAAEERSARQERAEERRRELSAEDAIRIYGSGLKSLRLRLTVLGILCILMIALTLLPELGFPLPDLIAAGKTRLALLLVLLLLSIFCGMEVFSSGITMPFRGGFGPETLVAASVLFALADAALQLALEDRAYGTPFCAAAGTSLFFATFGELKGRIGFRLSFRVADKTKVPTVLSAEWEKVDEGAVISKNVGAARGFVERTTNKDMVELVYARLAPVLLLLTVLFALLCSFSSGEKNAFFHCLSAFGAVAAGFDLLLAFNRPFCSAARELVDHGAALAGWEGAEDMQRAVGMALRDGDIFPENSLRLSGLKIFSHYSEEKIVSYTGSLIVASGIGTSRVFAELMREYGADLYRVEELSCYESGGIGANINGSEVLVGSAGFMNLMGIRLPPNLELRSAVFSAIDHELAGVFIVSYTPSNAVQAALVNMLQARIRPIFALRDFNLTPAMISGKFKITLDEGEFMTYAARYELSENSAEPAQEPSAIMSREGIGHYVETVRCGRRLCRSARISLGLTIAGTVLGMLLLLLIFMQGAFGSASAGNVFLFLLLWEFATWLFSSF